MRLKGAAFTPIPESFDAMTDAELYALLNGLRYIENQAYKNILNDALAYDARRGGYPESVVQAWLSDDQAQFATYNQILDQVERVLGTRRQIRSN
jgi:hypothetical protein